MLQNKIKSVPFIIAMVILAIGLWVTVTAMAAPSSSTQEKPVTQLSYQQSGAFDYRAYMKPAYFYGDESQTTASKQIPVPYIQSINMGYEFTPAAPGPVNVRVDAILVNPIWQKTVVLVPEQPENSSFKLSFPLDLASLTGLADTINKDLGTTSPSLNVTLRAEVTGGAMDFIQTLPLNISGSFLTINGGLAQQQGDASGIFSYAVKLSDNPLYGATTITSPAVTVKPPVVLDPGSTIFNRLIDHLDFSYTYNVSADKGLSQVAEDVTVNAMVESPKQWSETLVIVPSTKKNGKFTLDFPIVPSHYLDIFNTIQNEAGVSATTDNLTIDAEVHLTAQTDYGPIDKTFSQAITTDLTSGILAWSGGLQKTVPDTIDSKITVPVTSRLWGMPVSDVRILSPVILCLGLFSGIIILAVPERKASKSALLKQYVRQRENKYKNMIVMVNELPEARIGENVLTVASLDELVKVSQSQLKTINHTVNGDIDVYWLTDGSTRYEYVLSGGAGEESGAAVAERAVSPASDRDW